MYTALSLILSAIVSLTTSLVTLHVNDTPVQTPDFSNSIAALVSRIDRVEDSQEIARANFLRLQESVQETIALGATNDVPTVVALFETSLASAITSSQTTMTLVSATDKTGTALASSTYAFIIDEGTASEEMVIADCTSTVCTNMTRGISPITGTTTVTALQKAHRRGASVKITDGPQLLILSRILNGIGSIPSLLYYKSGTVCTVGSPNSSVCDKGYHDSVASSGAADANETTKGLGEIATAIEQASSTVTGSTGANLILWAKYASSSPTTGCSGSTRGALCTVIAQNDGTINPIPYAATSSSYTYRWSASHFFNTLVTFASFITTTSTTTNATTTNLYVSGTVSGNIANTASTSVWTADGTWTKPANAKMVSIQLWGGGGSGGVGQNDGTGGGGGEYREWEIRADQLASTVTVTVGLGGTAVATAGNSNGNTGGTTSFGSHLVAIGGGAGGGSASGDDSPGGTGGNPLGALSTLWGISESTDLEKHGIYSAAGGYYDHAVAVLAGGNSYWGGAGGGTGGSSPASSSAGGTSTHGGNGGAGAQGAGPTATAGSAPGGGGGGARLSSGTGTSGAGGLGRAIITTYF